MFDGNMGLGRNIENSSYKFLRLSQNVFRQKKGSQSARLVVVSATHEQ